jgi:hypothetical protein
LLDKIDLLGANDCEGALLGKDDGATDRSNFLGLTDGEADATFLVEEDADGALLGNDDGVADGR